MEKPRPERYWSCLRAWLPGHYRHRTSLAPGYTLQVSGQEHGGRHRLVLYALSPAGRMYKILSKRFRIQDPEKDAPGKARALALEMLMDMLDRPGKRGVPEDGRLRSAVEGALDEYAAKPRE